MWKVWGQGHTQWQLFSFWVGHVIYSRMLIDSMQSPLCFLSTSTVKMRLLHTESNKWKHPVGGLWMACLKERREKRKDWRLCSLLIMCTLRASDKPTSQDGCEKVERNARSLPAQSELQIRSWQHILTHTHQRRTSKVHYLPPLEATNTNQHGEDLHGSRPSVSAHLSAKQSACVQQQTTR